MKTLQKFFLFCAGIDLPMLEKCPTDVHKYLGIGATVFFTGVLAFFSSAYALFTVFESYIAAGLFGLVWGLMIFNLDRYIVLSMKRYGNLWRDLLVALPRLAMAVLLAVVISKPLELKIFEKEIEAELVQMEQEVYKQQEDRVKDRFAAQIESEKTRITALKAEIVAKTAARDTLARAAASEADGTGGSGLRNLGPIYRAKKADAELAQAELDKLLAIHLPQIQQHEQAIAALEAIRQGEVARLERSRYNGFAARIEALGRLTDKSAVLFYASIFIMLLFIAIETAPVLVKLISYRSPYDFVMHEHEHVFEMNNLEKTTLLGAAVKNKLKFETETGAYILNARIAAEQALTDHKLKEALESMKNRPYDWKSGNVL